MVLHNNSPDIKTFGTSFFKEQEQLSRQSKQPKMTVLITLICSIPGDVECKLQCGGDQDPIVM